MTNARNESGGSAGSAKQGLKPGKGVKCVSVERACCTALYTEIVLCDLDLWRMKFEVKAKVSDSFSRGNRERKQWLPKLMNELNLSVTMSGPGRLGTPFRSMLYNPGILHSRDENMVKAGFPLQHTHEGNVLKSLNS